MHLLLTIADRRVETTQSQRQVKLTIDEVSDHSSGKPCRDVELNLVHDVFPFQDVSLINDQGM